MDGFRYHSPFAIRHSLRRRKALSNDRFQRRADEFCHQLRGGVVGAGGFALHARGKLELAVLNDGLMVQQAFVDGAQLLHIQRGVVDAAVGARFLVPVVDQVEECLQQVPVREGAIVQLHRPEEPAIQNRKPQETCQRLFFNLRARVAQQVKEHA